MFKKQTNKQIKTRQYIATLHQCLPYEVKKVQSSQGTPITYKAKSFSLCSIFFAPLYVRVLRTIFRAFHKIIL